VISRPWSESPLALAILLNLYSSGLAHVYDGTACKRLLWELTEHHRATQPRTLHGLPASCVSRRRDRTSTRESRRLCRPTQCRRRPPLRRVSHRTEPHIRRPSRDAMDSEPPPEMRHGWNDLGTAIGDATISLRARPTPPCASRRRTPSCSRAAPSAFRRGTTSSMSSTSSSTAGPCACRGARARPVG
jgi:hypothetical protein